MADETQPQAAGAPPAAPYEDPQALVDQFKKDELVAAAAVQGVEVPSGATKADIAEAIVSKPVKAAPVIVNNFTRRSDEDALEGGWVDVVGGEYAGRFGSFRHVTEYGSDGFPKTVAVRTRDEFNELLSVAYEDLRPSKRTGGR